MSIRFVAVLPERPASDDAWAEIASGELTVTIPGAEPIVIATTKDQQLTPSREVEDPRFVAAQSTMVELSFQYIDDAGNLSLLPATAVVELLDTVPPVDPTSVGLRAVEEIPDPPTPEPPPVP